MQKLLVIALSLVANLALQGYAHYASKIQPGITNSFFYCIKWIWLFLIINTIYAYCAKSGTDEWGNFLVFIVIWIATGTLSAAIFHWGVDKQPVNWIQIAGLVLVFLGSVAVVGNKELMDLLKK